MGPARTADWMRAFGLLLWHLELARPKAEVERYYTQVNMTDVRARSAGPVHKAFAALEADRQAVLEADLIALLRRANQGGAAGLVVPAEYLETVITR